MDNVNLEDLLNDPNMLTKVRILANRERALAVGAMFDSLAGALKRVWGQLHAARPSAAQRAAHCG
jgi:hypothetical protein